MKFQNKFCAVLCAALLLVSLAACSKAGGADSVETGKMSQDSSSQTQIVGKVTSVVGNQVTLAIGTLSGSGEKSGSARSGSSGSGERKRSGSSASSRESSSSSAPSSAEPSSSSSASSKAEGTSSGLITLTGETQTVLIPVGLSLTMGGTKSGASSGGTGNSQSEAKGGAPTGGGELPGRSDSTPGGKSGPAQGAGTAMTTQRTRDFSSITKGMILQITEKTLSDGTQGIVKVAVLSESA
ncbi:hypothetical protein A7X67_11685 [Clostridium sp. W14A]|nr:hypothetical protein A7X67_11685 [Clostridium sp. W14A]